MHGYIIISKWNVRKFHNMIIIPKVYVHIPRKMNFWNLVRSCVERNLDIASCSHRTALSSSLHLFLRPSFPSKISLQSSVPSWSYWPDWERNLYCSSRRSLDRIPCHLGTLFYQHSLGSWQVHWKQDKPVRALWNSTYRLSFWCSNGACSLPQSQLSYGKWFLFCISLRVRTNFHGQIFALFHIPRLDHLPEQVTPVYRRANMSADSVKDIDFCCSLTHV